MLGVEMYYTVKTLLGQVKNISQIARQLGIDRKTVRKIRDKVKDGEVKPPKFSRRSVLYPYRDNKLPIRGFICGTDTPEIDTTI